jgi:hypothetical protein
MDGKEVKEFKIPHQVFSTLFKNSKQVSSKLKISNVSVYSSTPWDQAEEVVKIIHSLYDNPKSEVILDASANVGGNLIELVKLGTVVNAVELSKFHFDMLVNNTKILLPELIDTVNFINGNIADKKILRAVGNSTIGFFDPPWGGAGYRSKKSVPLGYNNSNGDYVRLFKLFELLALDTVILKAPVNLQICMDKIKNMFKYNYQVNIHAGKKNKKVLYTMLIFTNRSSVRINQTLKDINDKSYTNLVKVIYKYSKKLNSKTGGKTSFAFFQEPMFITSGSDHYEKVVRKAVKLIDKFNAPYLKIKSTIMDYCKKNSLAISSLENTCCKEDELSPELSIVNMYVGRPLDVAKALSDFIYATHGGIMRLIKHTKDSAFVIEFDSVKVARIRLIPQKILKIGMVLVDGYKNIPPEMELIDLYTKLYSLNHVDEWTMLKSQENSLISAMDTRMKKLKSGGANKKCVPCAKKQSSFLLSVKRDIVENFIANSEHILMGGWAVRILDKSYAYTTSIEKEVIQIASSGTAQLAVNDISAHIEKYSDVSVSHVVQRNIDLGDSRSKKYKIYIHIKNTDGSEFKKPVVDIFNISEFELIPYNPIKVDAVEIRIANMFVILKYLYVDLLNVQVLKGMGQIPDTFAKKRISVIYSFINDTLNPELNLIKSCFGIDYIGVYSDQGISENLKKNKSHIFYPYYPALS